MLACGDTTACQPPLEAGTGPEQTSHGLGRNHLQMPHPGLRATRARMKAGCLHTDSQPAAWAQAGYHPGWRPPRTLPGVQLGLLDHDGSRQIHQDEDTRRGNTSGEVLKGQETGNSYRKPRQAVCDITKAEVRAGFRRRAVADRCEQAATSSRNPEPRLEQRGGQTTMGAEAQGLASKPGHGNSAL